MNNNTNNAGLLDIDFKDLAMLLLKRLWVMIICFAILFSYKWFFVEQKKSPLWTSSATMYVTSSNQTKTIFSTSDTYNAQNLIKTCAVVIQTNQVRQQIADQLNSMEAAKAEAAAEEGQTYEPYVFNSGNIGSISISSIDSTEVMSIAVTTSDPNKSVDVCNAILKVVPKILKEKIMVGAANPIDSAQSPYKSNLPAMKSAIVYGLIGAAIAAVVIIIIYLLDNRIRSKEEVTQQYGISILSDIPNMNAKTKERYKTYYEHR
ncbi:MAG: hypothetical protein IKN38_06145 [Clostridia bacterium]|nr:hypothetical protein [Clostridia bacterium]